MKLHFAFRRVTSRNPDNLETRTLLAALGRYRERFMRERKAAKALINVGDSEPDQGLDAVDLAAWTTVMNVLLNLDETITKG